MKDGKPETLEEALRLIEEQNRRLSEKENQLKQKESQLKQNSILLEQKYKELDEANKEILEKIAEIKLLNEKLAVKRAREWVARTGLMTKLLKDQPLLFDAEELGIKLKIHVRLLVMKKSHRQKQMKIHHQKKRKLRNQAKEGRASQQ